VKPHYAVKANPNPTLLRLMAHDLKMNFDCASKHEIESVLKLGVSPNRIVYANPCKPVAHIGYAQRNGVFRTTFDSESELRKIADLGNARDWQLILRIWVDDKDAQCQLSNKFGAHVDEWRELMTLAKKLRLNVVGVSFHVGSGAKMSAFRDALRASRSVFEMGQEMKHPMTLLDIGGGFPGTCSSESSLVEIGNIIRPEIDKFPSVEMIAEPGRYFCAEAQTLATQIIGKRIRNAGSKNVREYYVNDGLYQSFNCMLFDHSTLLDEDGSDVSQEGPKYHSAIFGQTCDGLDQISKDILLPDLLVNDWLVVPNMGAYTNGASSQFNGFPLCETVVLDNSEEEVGRHEEATPEVAFC